MLTGGAPGERGCGLRRGREMSERPVLVVGAAGRTGRLIVGRLVERGASVRALVRDAAKGREVLPAEVPLFVGDVRLSETLTEPMAARVP